MASTKSRLRASLERAFAGEPFLVQTDRDVLGSVDFKLRRRLPDRLAQAITEGSTLLQPELALLRESPGEREELGVAVRAQPLGALAIRENEQTFHLPWLEASKSLLRPAMVVNFPAVALLSEVEIGIFSAHESALVPPHTGALKEQRDVSLLGVAVDAWKRVAALRHEEPPERGDSELAGPAIPRTAPDDLRALPPLPFLTAALEAVGADREEYGFLLRYGLYAPEEQQSDIRVGGLGLAEFSKRVATWMQARQAAKFPLQVVDDGSGELTVHLLGPEAPPTRVENRGEQVA